MNRNNNISLFDKAVIDLLKHRKIPMSVSDISVILKQKLPEKELPPRGYFLEWISKIKCLIRNDTIKKNMPYFNYNIENAEIVHKKESDESIFLKKYKNDFYIWLNNFKKYKMNNSTNYKMWDALKKDYDVKIIKTTYPNLIDKISNLRLKKMPVEVALEDSPKTINIIYKQEPLKQLNTLSSIITQQESQKNDVITPKPYLNIPKSPGFQDDLLFEINSQPVKSTQYLNTNIVGESLLGLSQDVSNNNKSNSNSIWENLGKTIEQLSKPSEESKVSNINYDLSYLSNNHPYYDLSYESILSTLSSHKYNSGVSQQPMPQYNSGVSQQPMPQYNSGLSLQPIPQYNSGVSQQPMPQYNSGLSLQPIPQYNSGVSPQPMPQYNSGVSPQPMPYKSYYQQPNIEHYSRQPQSTSQYNASYQQPTIKHYSEQLQEPKPYHSSSYQHQNIQQYNSSYSQTLANNIISPTSELNSNAIPYIPDTLTNTTDNLEDALFVEKFRKELNKLDSNQLAIVINNLLKVK
jgi:hypothetical protein